MDLPNNMQENKKFPAQSGTTKPSLSHPSQATDSSAISFEAKIGLALQGANWQELQRPATTTSPMGLETLGQEGATIGSDLAGSEVDVPKEMTAKQKKKGQRFRQAIARDAGDIVEVIEADSLRPILEKVVWDGDPELLCCYNWKASNDGTNTIFVPGQPAKWQPPTLPYALEPDSGFQYLDYNYARQPQHPYDPMFHALETMNPGYRFNNVDVLADRNNLRVLLEFAQGKANSPFRLNLYLNIKTLIIVRKESRWWQVSDGTSYGCNLERFFTHPAEGMEDATSHYRAIRYSMGPLSVVCRFEADAYDDGIASDEPMGTEKTMAVKDILKTRPTWDFRAPIQVVQRGQIIPTAQMVELKTQKYNPSKSASVACQDQLWFGRTSLLFTAPYEHNTGIISRVKCGDATARIKNWENSNQESLRKLVSLLAELRGILKSENRALVLVREEKDGPLLVRLMEANYRPTAQKFFQKHWAFVPNRKNPPHNGPHNQ